jgi:ribosomal protein S18 acetylase RimI-like enzyme
MMLRNMKLTDKSAIEMLGRTLFREEDEIPLLQKALHLCIPELSFVIEDKEILGFTLVCKKMTNVYYSFMGSIPNCYELAFVGISPACQGRGCGSRLLKETLVSIFQQTNQFTCWLIVDVINTSAIRLYEKLGFRRWIQTTPDMTPYPGYIMGLSHRRYHFEHSAQCPHRVSVQAIRCC